MKKDRLFCAGGGTAYSVFDFLKLLFTQKIERKISYNNEISLSEFETISVSARKGLFFCKNFCSLLDNRIWTTREKPDFMRVCAA